MASLEVGDEVLTSGGLIGTIVGLNDTEALIEVSPGVVMRFVRFAVNGRVGDRAGDSDDDTPDELTKGGE